MLRRFCARVAIPRGAAARFAATDKLSVPWPVPAAFHPPGHVAYKALGRAVVVAANEQDAGPDAFAECRLARDQLEAVVQGSSYPGMRIELFGGVAAMGLLESGGDLDFVGITPDGVEPDFPEQVEMVNRLSRDLRRVGLRSQGIKARVPVVKVTRTSNTMPGAPSGAVACQATFRFPNAISVEVQAAFDDHLKSQFGALKCVWGTGGACTATFKTTTAAIAAIASNRHASFSGEDSGGVLRLPLSVRQGPELYRHSFDLVLRPAGLVNALVLRDAFVQYPYARHLLLLAKRWARSAYVVDPIDGLLSNHCVCLMVLHFLVAAGRVQPVSVQKASEKAAAGAGAPGGLGMDTYWPLPQKLSDEEAAEVGLLATQFFHFYSTIFDATKDVVCPTAAGVTRNTLGWVTASSKVDASRPPFFALCVKDPTSVENAARNVDAASADFVFRSIAAAAKLCAEERDDPEFLVNKLRTKPPRAHRTAHVHRPSEHSKATGSGGGEATTKPKADDVAAEARRTLQRLEFHARKDDMVRQGDRMERRKSEGRAARDLTRAIVQWIRSANKSSAPRGGAAAAGLAEAAK